MLEWGLMHDAYGISEHYIHPGINKSIAVLMNECQDNLSVIKLEPVKENK